MVETTTVEMIHEDGSNRAVRRSLHTRGIIRHLVPVLAVIATTASLTGGVGAATASGRSVATSTTLQAVTPGAHLGVSAVSVAPKRVGSVTKHALATPFTPTIDWAAGLTFGTFNNVGAHAVADCTLAAAASYEQIVQGSRTPLKAGPWLAEYTALVVAVGKAPGPKAGVFPAALFRAWELPNQTGTRIVAATPIRTAVGVLRSALKLSPVFVTINLVPAAHNTRSTLDSQTGIVSIPWSSAVTGPYGPSTVTESHSALLVGIDELHKDFLVETWGQTYAIPYRYFETMITAAWTIQQ